MDVRTRYERAWGELKELPERVTAIHETTWDEFRLAVSAGDQPFVDHVIGALSRGAVWIVHGVFAPEFMAELKAKTLAWERARPAAFHKMIDGSPDFHRVIDPETGNRYAFPCCKHSAYFYRWNDDPLGIWPTVTERWRVFKLLMGLAPDAYEQNVPSDGVVDRVQVVRYPPGIGFLAPHQDPHQHQRLFFSAYMTKRGVDYQGGGFYALGNGGSKVDLERFVSTGDVCVGMASLVHGVAPCEGAPDWNADDGRWFLSMYSNATDAVPDRATGRPAQLPVYA